MAFVLQRGAALQSSVPRCSRVGGRCFSTIDRSLGSTPPVTPAIHHSQVHLGRRQQVSGVVAGVFGCTGMLGRFVVEALSRSGCQVICPYRGDFMAARQLKVSGDLGQVVPVPFDLRADASIEDVVKKCDVVINLIGSKHESQNWNMQEVNRDGVQRIAELSKKAGVERLIHVSAFKPPVELPTDEHYTAQFYRRFSRFERFLYRKAGLSPLAGSVAFLRNWDEAYSKSLALGFHLTKLAGEAAVREAFPEATIIRPGSMYGTEDENFFNQLGEGVMNANFFAKPFGGFGGQRNALVSPVALDDITKAIINCALDAGTESKTYDLIGPETLPFNDMMKLFLEETGLELKIVPPIKLSEVYPHYPMPHLQYDQVAEPGNPGFKELGITPDKMAKHLGLLLGHFRVHTPNLFYNPSEEGVHIPW